MTTKLELQTLMQEVEAAKNRFLNRSGYSPVQCQIGQWPRVSGVSISDGLVDPALIEGAVGDDIERLHELRRLAQKAFIEHNAKEVMSRAQHSSSKVAQEFNAGDYVYVYRVPRQRKRNVGPQWQSQQQAILGGPCQMVLACG